MTQEQRDARITELQAMAAKRRNQPGFQANVEDIDRRIARLRQGLEEVASGD